MKKRRVEKLLWSIARAASETTSVVCLFEPRTPKKLMKKTNEEN